MCRDCCLHTILLWPKSFFDFFLPKYLIFNIWFSLKMTQVIILAGDVILLTENDETENVNRKYTLE